MKCWEIMNRVNNSYPLTVFKTRSFSEILPRLTDQGTSALIRAGVPTCLHRKNKTDQEPGEIHQQRKGLIQKLMSNVKLS